METSLQPIVGGAEKVNLTIEQQKKVDEIMNNIDITNSQFVLQYGIGAQTNIASFADSILNEVKSKDSGQVGVVLSDLMLKVKELDVDSLSQKKGGFFSNIFNSANATVEKFKSRYQKLSTQIEGIVDNLDRAKMQLLKDITMLDSLFDKNYEYLKDLDLYIYAGSTKLKELQEQVIPQMRDRATSSGDPLDAQQLNDVMQLANRFEKKIYDLKLSRTISIQTAPQIRLIQNNNQVLVEKIQSSLLNTIPLWKNQIVIAISLLRQKDALQLQKEVTDTTNELLLKNSEMLKTSTIDIAKESERGIVDVETLKKVNEDLLITIEETLRIQKEGSTKRQAAEFELQQIENQLKQKLLEVKN